MNPTVERVFRLRDCDLIKEGLRLHKVILAIAGLFLMGALGLHVWFLWFMKPLSQEVYTPTPQLLGVIKASKGAPAILGHIETSEIAIHRYIDRFHVISVCSFAGLAVLLLSLSLTYWKLFELALRLRPEGHRISPDAPSPKAPIDLNRAEAE